MFDSRVFARTLPLLLALPFTQGTASAQSRTYTTNADFAEGALINVNSDAPGTNQLQLNDVANTSPLPFINVPATLRGTIVRIDVNTGAVIGEYRTAPNGELRGPSRTAVDSRGNVWVGNRDFAVGGNGSVVKIGIVIGGTRVNSDGTPNPMGGYLAPPYQYNTCVDRDGDGLIRTSRGLGDILGWPNANDTGLGADGIVQDALDECIQIYKQVSGSEPRHLSVDAADDVWVGGYPFMTESFDKVSGVDGAILSNFSPACGGHGGLVDGNGIVWSTSLVEAMLMRHNPATMNTTCIPSPGSFGLGIDSQGNLWNTQAGGTILKLSPAGVVQPGFPVATGGAGGPRSVTVTPSDDHIWIANSSGSDVSRLDNAGNLLKVIQLGADGQTPTGLSVDSNGKVWAINRDSRTAKRIDPDGDVDNLGIVDLTVGLGANADPTALTDMTGQVPLSVFTNRGSWNVVFDSGAAGTAFGTITTNTALPSGTGIEVFVRAADAIADLPGADFISVQSAVQFAGVTGQYAEIRVDFTRDDPLGPPPVLFDLTIEALDGVEPPAPKVVGQRTPGSLLLFPEFDNRNGSVSVLTVTNVGLGQGGSNSVRVEYVYRARYGQGGQEINCTEHNLTELFTPGDTLTALTTYQNPNYDQGFVYAFAKDAATGEPIVHNQLVGSLLVVNAWKSLEYSLNPFSFEGIGEPGESTNRDGDSIRDLDGIEYSQVADEILVPRFLGQHKGSASELILINLTGGSAFRATVNFLVYNDNEEAFSLEHEFRCWQKITLNNLSGTFSQQFLAGTNQDPAEIMGATGVESGWFRMNGGTANSVNTSINDPAILGVLIENLRGHSASDLPFERGCQDNGDLYPNSILGDN